MLLGYIKYILQDNDDEQKGEVEQENEDGDDGWRRIIEKKLWLWHVCGKSSALL